MSSDGPAFSRETLLLATDRRRVGEPVEAVADILFYLFGCLREDDCRGRQMIRTLLEECEEKILKDDFNAYVKMWMEKEREDQLVRCDS
jgi:hypothetical protein